MNTTLPPVDGTDDQDLVAAEYVLGVLPDVARAQAEARLSREPGFAAEVDAWESHFAPWIAAIAPVIAPASVWSRISAALWPQERLARPTTASGELREPLWNRLAFWRGLAGGGFAVAAASVAALLLVPRTAPTPSPPVPTPVVIAPPASTAAAPMVVSLRNDDGSMAYVATVEPSTGTITLVPVQLSGNPDTSPELWLIPEGGSPHSLGMVPRDRAMVLNLPAALRDAASKGVFAITLEPAGSSAHQAPTGPVAAKGNGILL